MDSFGNAKRKRAILTIDQKREIVHYTIVYYCIMKRVRIYFGKISEIVFKLTNIINVS